MSTRWTVGFMTAVAALAVSAFVLIAGAGTTVEADNATPTPPSIATLSPEAGTPVDPGYVGQYGPPIDPDRPPPLSQELRDRIAAKEQAVKEWYAEHPDKLPENWQPTATVQTGTQCEDYYGVGAVGLNDIFYVGASFATPDLTANLDYIPGVGLSDVLVAAADFGRYCWRSGVTTIGRQYEDQGNGPDDPHRPYWCGPASVVEALRIKPGRFGTVDEDTAAYLLNSTVPDGTAWYGVNANVPPPYGSGYPVPDVLNYELGTTSAPAAYVIEPYPTDVDRYKLFLVYDINNHVPVVGDAHEPVGELNRLRGHPIDQLIGHWFTISGYENSGTGGDLTNYMDSAQTVWSAVNRWNTLFPSNTMLSILSGRGYVW